MRLDLNAKLAAENNTSHLSPLEFVKYAVRTLQTFSNFHHKVRERCSDVGAMMEKEFELTIGCTQTVRNMDMNHFILFQYATKRRILQYVTVTNNNRMERGMKNPQEVYLQD